MVDSGITPRLPEPHFFDAGIDQFSFSHGDYKTASENHIYLIEVHVCTTKYVLEYEREAKF